MIVNRTPIVPPVKVIVDDATGQDITNGGWALGGANGPVDYHFQNLSGLAAALLTKPEVFGLSAGDFYRGGNYITDRLAREHGLYVSATPPAPGSVTLSPEEVAVVLGVVDGQPTTMLARLRIKNSKVYRIIRKLKAAA